MGFEIKIIITNREIEYKKTINLYDAQWDYTEPIPDDTDYNSDESGSIRCQYNWNRIFLDICGEFNNEAILSDDTILKSSKEELFEYYRILGYEIKIFPEYLQS